MKARLYVKTAWIFKHVDTIQIVAPHPLLKVPIKQGAIRVITTNFIPVLTLQTPVNPNVDFVRVGYDKFNEEYMYISYQ